MDEPHGLAFLMLADRATVQRSGQARAKDH
jgi:hypothetical protein